jgi:serine/threonine-protein kinase
MLPNEIAGKYELRGTLGAGAMGTVYDAVDRMIERRVAIKVVKRPPPGDPEGEEAHGRFRREAQAAGRLAHNNIVGVYDYGENAETAWIVMELVEGSSLKDRLDKKERFPVAEIVRVMDQVLAALAYSHGRGVVHRDIKPANIMMAHDGTVKMADFGIARLENSSMTQVGTVMGTPSYMSPEQLRGETVDARADIWASGVMLYQLLTGEKPFDGGLAALMHKALHTEPVPPSQLSVTTPRAFDAVVAKALAKRPEERWPTAIAFAEAIRNAAVAPTMPPVDAFAAAPDAEATMVAGARPAAPAAAPRLVDPFDAAPAVAAAPIPAPAAATPAAAKKPPIALIAGGGVAALIAAGVAGFLLLGGDGGQPARQDPAAQLVPQPDPERDRRAAEAQQAEAARLASEQRAREQQALADQARGQAQTEAQRQAAEQRTREEAARLQAAREESERARRQAEQARLEADQRAEEVRRADAARQQQQTEAQARQEEDRRRAERLSTELPLAGAAAASAAPCSLLTWTATPTTLTISGVIRRGGEVAVRQAIVARGIPSEAVRLQLSPFDGPYCQALDLIRSVAAPPEAAPQVQLLGTQPLAKGDLVRMDVLMPPAPAQLYLAYLMQSGEVAHLVASRPEAANARPRLGEPSGGFTGWEVDEPFGTDLALVFASDRPIFPQRRPVVEQADAYLSALASGIRQAQAQGGRVTARAVVIETVRQR